MSVVQCGLFKFFGISPAGELSQNQGSKKSERDFALWKASKPGEPAWDSPWGKVKPLTQGVGS